VECVSPAKIMQLLAALSAQVVSRRFIGPSLAQEGTQNG